MAQTAMQEAIDTLRSYGLLSSAIILEQRFLKKERQQIVDAHFNSSAVWNNENGRNAGVEYYELRAEQYYKQTYGNKAGQ